MKILTGIIVAVVLLLGFNSVFVVKEGENALLLQFAPSPFTLTRDQVTLLQTDNVVSDAAKAAGLTLEGLGITPDSLEAVAPQYLWRFRPQGQFQRKNA